MYSGNLLVAGCGSAEKNICCFYEEPKFKTAYSDSGSQPLVTLVPRDLMTSSGFPQCRYIHASKTVKHIHVLYFEKFYVIYF